MPLDDSDLADFVAATDVLFSKITGVQLAQNMNIALSSVTQCRITTEHKKRRLAPKGWKKAVCILAAMKIKELTKLIDDVAPRDPIASGILRARPDIPSNVADLIEDAVLKVIDGRL